MHVLTIGSDRKLFDVHSAVSARMIAYGKKIGALHVIVFTNTSQGYTKIKLSDEVTVYPTNSLSRWLYVYDAIRLGKRIVAGEKFVRGDSVITCQDPFECGLVGWRIASKFRLPLHLQIHTDFLSPYFRTSFLQSIRIMLGKFLLPKAAGVRVVSQRIVSSLHYAGIRLMHPPHVLPIRIDVVKPSSGAVVPKAFSSFTFTIAMASRLEKEKRIEDALEVCKKVCEVYPHSGLIIAGDGSQKSHLQAYASRIGIADNVRFVGWVDDVSMFIASADLFLSVSEYEGYGMSMIEAGLLGVPVVTTDVGIAHEVIINNKNGYVCPVGDKACITRSIMELIAHNEKRHEFGAALRDDIERSIPPFDEYVDMYVKDLRDILVRT